MSEPESSEEKSTAGRNYAVPIVVGLLILFMGIRLAMKYGSRPEEKLAPTSPSNTVRPMGYTTNLPTANANAALTESEQATKLINEGTELLATGRVDEAVAKFQSALQLTPEDEDVHYDLAIAFARLGKTAEAIHHYEEALRLFPDYVEAHNNLGNLLLKQAKLDEAGQHFRAAAKLAPDNAIAHNGIGIVLGRQGKPGEAIAEFLEAVRLDPQYVEGRFNLGNTYLMQKNGDAAAEQFTEILKINPTFELAAKGLTNAQALMARRKIIP